MPDPKGSHLYVNLGAFQVRRRLKGIGHGVGKVQTAGRNQAVIIHTAILQFKRIIHKLHEPIFGLTHHALDVILYCAIALLKLLVLVFFCLPRLAIKLMLRK